MNDDSTNKDIENTEAELVDPDETELIDQKKLGLTTFTKK